MDGHKTLTPAARWLGYAGLLPQIICLGLALAEPGPVTAAGALSQGEPQGGFAWAAGWGYAALAAGFAYAAAIFSFLGGVWWGQAIARSLDRPVGAGAYIIAVLPSLIAVALFLPWLVGWDWPGPALFYLGVLIALSPLVDFWLGFAARDFLSLRVQLSVGLGVLTVLLGVAAHRLV